MAATEIFGRVPKSIKHDVEVVGVLKGTTISGPLTTAAQPNVTSLGVLTGLTMGGALDMGSHGLIDLPEPASAQDAATKNYVDNHVQDLSGYMLLDGSRPMAGDLAMGGHNLTGLGILGSTGTRVTKGWFTDLTVTNAIHGSVDGSAATAGDSALLGGKAEAALNVLSAGSASTAADLSATLSVAHGGTGQTAYSNGQLLIGNGSGLTKTTLTGTGNQVAVTNGAGSITLSGPQDLGTTSAVIFGGATLGGLTLNGTGSVVDQSAQPWTAVLSTTHNTFRAQLGSVAITDEVALQGSWHHIAAISGVTAVPAGTTFGGTIYPQTADEAGNTPGIGVHALVKSSGDRDALAFYGHAYYDGTGNVADGGYVQRSIQGMNLVVEDNAVAARLTVAGIEIDLNIDNANNDVRGIDISGNGIQAGAEDSTVGASVANPYTGHIFTMQGAVPKSKAIMIRHLSGLGLLKTYASHASALTNADPDSGGRWAHGVYIEAGSCVRAITINQQQSAQWGADSMWLTFVSVDSGGGGRESFFFADKDGMLTLAAGGGQVLPTGNGAQDFGGPSRRWGTLYAVQPLINTSSRAVKHSIERIDPAEALDVVRHTPIYSYQYVEDPNKRPAAPLGHVGFMAEEADPILMVDTEHTSGNTIAGVVMCALQELAAQVEKLQREVSLLRDGK